MLKSGVELALHDTGIDGAQDKHLQAGVKRFAARHISGGSLRSLARPQQLRTGALRIRLGRCKAPLHVLQLRRLNGGTIADVLPLCMPTML